MPHYFQNKLTKYSLPFSYPYFPLQSLFEWNGPGLEMVKTRRACIYPMMKELLLINQHSSKLYLKAYTLNKQTTIISFGLVTNLDQLFQIVSDHGLVLPQNGRLCVFAYSTEESSTDRICDSTPSQQSLKLVNR